MKRFIVVGLVAVFVLGCISKPNPMLPEGNGDGGGGDSLVDSGEGNSDANAEVGVADRNLPDKVGEVHGDVWVPGEVADDAVVSLDVVDAGETAQLDVADMVDFVDLLDVTAEAIDNPDVNKDEVDTLQPDIQQPDPGPPVVRPMAFFGTASGGGLNLTPVVVAGHSGQTSSGGGLVLNGGVVANNMSE